jgi:carbonic anhydrase
LQSFKNSTPTKDVQPESWANAKGVARDLVAQSKILSEKIRSGEVKIVSALYHLGSGEVQFAE